MKWFSNLFSKTTTTEEDIEIKIGDAEEKFDLEESLKRMNFAIDRLAAIGWAYRAFYYLSSQAAKTETYKKLPKEVAEFMQEDMKDRDMSSWDKYNNKENDNENT